MDISSHPLDTEKQHKLRLRGPNGSKVKTSLLVSTVLERTDKSTATKLMKKRAKSFSKKDIKRSLLKARTSMSQLRDKTMDGLSTSSNHQSESQSTYSGSIQSLDHSPSYIGASSGSFNESSDVKQTNIDKEPPKFRLHVQFYECANLCGKGSKQFSDTFVKLRIGDQEFKSRTVEKNANPKFNETFEFDLYDLTEPLRVRVSSVMIFRIFS